jgi:toxin ParE1/3/4
VRVEWTGEAELNALDIADHIAIDSPSAALAQIREIRTQVDQLARHPNLGRLGRVLGTRELVVARTPYIVAYRIEEAAVVVLRVLHGAQQWKL